MEFDINETFNPSYIGPRPDVVNLLPDRVNKVLDIGCSIGELGRNIKSKHKGAIVWGIEQNEQMAKVAESKLDRVITGDVEEIKLGSLLPHGYFNSIIFADVLEHLKDPWNVLKTCCMFLDRNGVVVASIPNIRHYTTIANLIFKGYWPYRERGIHDKTHLRFFTLKNIKELFHYGNLEITHLSRSYRIVERPHKINNYSKYIAFPPYRDFLVFQYLIVARMKSNVK